jgi:hypothetical protein
MIFARVALRKRAQTLLFSYRRQGKALFGANASLRVSSVTRWCNNRNVLRLRFAHFQRVIDSANSQNVLAGMNVSKVILPVGSCHCLANKAGRLIWLHLEKRDSDSDKGACKTDDASSQVGSTQYRGGQYEHFQEQNETEKLVAHREINDSMLSTGDVQAKATQKMISSNRADSAKTRWRWTGNVSPDIRARE